jgi:hypothetical protein
MNLGVKIGLAVVGLGAIGTAIYFAVRKKPDAVGNSTGTTPAPREGGADEQGIADKRQSSAFPLKLGSVGRNVLLLQQALGNVDVDGAYGMQTAIKAKTVCFDAPYIRGTSACEVSKADFDKVVSKAGGLPKVQAAVIASKPAIWNRYS